MMPRRLVALCVSALVVACNGPAATPDVTDASDVADVVDARDGTDGAVDPCEPFGRFGPPGETFTLPGPDAVGAMYIPDVQARFPAVPWATLDRLYIPAGTYSLINLGNLPVRTAARPLVITNRGGQVVLRPPASSRYGYLWSMHDGAHWVVTGRYDPVSGTGDAAFPGHRCEAYAASRGRYGILSDDAYQSGGHMGLGIDNAGAVEVEFVEITRSGFAGLRVLSPVGADGLRAPLDDYRIHDLYVHDTRSEAIYFGWTGAAPSPLVTNLQVYNNRFVRSGTEGLQVQNLGEGSEVHHNVVAFSALDWRAAFGPYQDNNAQVQVRSGSVRVHHNVFVGGASNLLNLFSGPEGADPGRALVFEDNYCADTLSLGAYLGGASGADSTYTFRRNTYRGLTFGYNALNPASPDYGVVFRVGATFTSPITLADNTWEGSQRLVAGLTGGDGTVANVTATGNRNAPVPAIEFVASGYPAGAPTRRLELWTARATLAPGTPAMRYEPGALVMHDGEMYECLVANTDQAPPTNATAWRHLALPADDLRTAPASPYAARGIGLLHP